MKRKQQLFRLAAIAVIAVITSACAGPTPRPPIIGVSSLDDEDRSETDTAIYFFVVEKKWR